MKDKTNINVGSNKIYVYDKGKYRIKESNYMQHAVLENDSKIIAANSYKM